MSSRFGRVRMAGLRSVLTCQRDQFEIPADISFLNAAYVSPISRSTRLAGERGVARKSRPWEIAWSDFHTEATVAREHFAQFIGATPQDIAIVPAVSYGMQVAARNLEFAADGGIVVLQDQFPSNLYVWRDLARERRGRLDAVRCPADWQWTEAILEAIDARTQIVALPQCHWANGATLDLVQISRRCREIGAALVLDLSQSLGVVPFAVSEVQPDFIVSASYKWLLGPYSLAFLYAAPQRQDGLPIEAHQWSRSNALSPPEWSPGQTPYPDDFLAGACRYDMGERANFALMPMAIAAMSQLATWRPAAIADYLRPLIDDLADLAQSLGSTRVPPPAIRSPHLIGFDPPPRAELGALRTRLAAAGVHISVRGGNLRVSPHIYNDQADMARLAAILTEAR